MTLQARAPSTEPAQSLYVSFLERFRPSARRLPGTAALKRAGTATLGRVLTAGGNALKRAKRFSGKERRQKALIISCAYGELISPSETEIQEAGPSRAAVSVPRASEGGLQPRLCHAHADGHNLKTMLQDKFNIHDIEFLIDEGAYDASTWPTSTNIRAAMTRLLHGATAGDNFVFAFIGHGGRMPNTDGRELDGFDEYIVAVDDSTLLDDELYQSLVDRLPNGCKLTTFFDCCHSGTALDLPYEHDTSNNEHIMLRVVPPMSLYRKLSQKHYLRSQLNRIIGRRSGNVPKRTIVSFSACRDDEKSWEFDQGYSLTDVLVRLHGVRPGYMTYTEMHRAVSGTFKKIGESRSNASSPHSQHPVLSSEEFLDESELFILTPPTSEP